ncbi:MAG: cytochrome c oxidase subunit II [Microbacteriaceae bacterium]
MRHNRRLRWAAIPIAATLVLILAGCTQAQLHGFLPGFVEGEAPVTNHTERVSGLWVTSWIVLLIIGFIVWGLILWTMVVYRRRKGQTGLPPQMRYNLPIEIFYTVVPFILVLGFFAFTVRDQVAIEARFPAPDQVIQVYAKQWAWDFDYKTEGAYSPGIQAQPDDSNARPGSIVEAELPTLYLPIGKKIELELHSRDVIHSFWVPTFLYKKDVIPGHINYMSLIPEREGTYAGKCAELCGEYHSQMLFNVKVVSQDKYDQYIASLKAAGYTGDLGSQYDRNQNLPGTSAPKTNE